MTNTLKLYPLLRKQG